MTDYMTILVKQARTPPTDAASTVPSYQWVEQQGNVIDLINPLVPQASAEGRAVRFGLTILLTKFLLG